MQLNTEYGCYWATSSCLTLSVLKVCESGISHSSKSRNECRNNPVSRGSEQDLNPEAFQYTIRARRDGGVRVL